MTESVNKTIFDRAAYAFANYRGVIASGGFLLHQTLKAAKVGVAVPSPALTAATQATSATGILNLAYQPVLNEARDLAEGLRTKDLTRTVASSARFARAGIYQVWLVEALIATSVILLTRGRTTLAMPISLLEAYLASTVTNRLITLASAYSVEGKSADKLKERDLVLALGTTLGNKVAQRLKEKLDPVDKRVLEKAVNEHLVRQRFTTWMGLGTDLAAVAAVLIGIHFKAYPLIPAAIGVGRGIAAFSLAIRSVGDPEIRLEPETIELTTIDADHANI